MLLNPTLLSILISKMQKLDRDRSSEDTLELVSVSFFDSSVYFRNFLKDYRFLQDPLLILAIINLFDRLQILRNVRFMYIYSKFDIELYSKICRVES